LRKFGAGFFSPGNMRRSRIPPVALLPSLSCFTLRLKPRKTGKAEEAQIASLSKLTTTQHGGKKTSQIRK
jgi:hypothetical protein